MSLIKSQWKFIERAVKTKDGRDAVALVAVFCVDDKVIKAELVNVKVLPTIETDTYPRICAEYIKSEAPLITRQNITEIISPYFDTFSFLVNQPTRAPSLNL